MTSGNIKKITDYVFINSVPCRADVAIVFGTRHSEPIDLVAKLCQNGHVEKVVLSGGVNSQTGQVEAEVMKNLLVGIGIDESRLIVENRSTNTLENVIFSKNVISEQIGLEKIGTIIAVVKHFHARRAVMTLRKHFPKNIKIVPVAYDIHGFGKEDWYNCDDGIEKVMGELEKIEKYLDKGDIEEL
ncbi:MAG: YdcF family protein [Patescibacteria group bacterium]|jgi:uncharacterized SAM-binding protein YcdF (DUF218 family)